MAHHSLSLATSTSCQRSYSPEPDLIFTRSCGTSSLCHPLPVSDHHFVAFSLPLKFSPSLLSPSQSPAAVTLSLSLPLRLPQLSSLPSVEQFSQLSTEEASDTMLSSLSSSLDSLCPFHSRPAQSSTPPPWLSESLRSYRAELRAAERK